MHLPKFRMVWQMRAYNFSIELFKTLPTDSSWELIEGIETYISKQKTRWCTTMPENNLADACQLLKMRSLLENFKKKGLEHCYARITWCSVEKLLQSRIYKTHPEAYLIWCVIWVAVSFQGKEMQYTKRTNIGSSNLTKISPSFHLRWAVVVNQEPMSIMKLEDIGGKKWFNRGIYKFFHSDPGTLPSDPHTHFIQREVVSLTPIENNFPIGHYNIIPGQITHITYTSKWAHSTQKNSGIDARPK